MQTSRRGTPYVALPKRLPSIDTKTLLMLASSATAQPSTVAVPLRLPVFAPGSSITRRMELDCEAAKFAIVTGTVTIWFEVDPKDFGVAKNSVYAGRPEAESYPERKTIPHLDKRSWPDTPRKHPHAIHWR